MADAKLIHDLGGDKAVADALNLKSSETVRKWRERGIAWPWRAQVAALAKSRRVRLPENFLSERAA